MRLLLCLPVCLLLSPGYAEPVPTWLDSTQRVPDEPVKAKHLPDLQSEPIQFLEACLKNYDKTVKTYTLRFNKQEFLLGKLQPQEVIEVHFREKPHSVHFLWHQGARLCTKALYVAGENLDAKAKSQVLAYSPLLRAVRENDPEGYFAKQTSRYPMTRFGFKQTMEHVLETWKDAHAAGALHVEYEGLHKVPQADGKTCYKFNRTQYAKPEGNDGVTELVLYIDRETLLQVGSIVYGKDRQLLGEYYFCDVKLNVEIPAEKFTRKAVE